MSKLSCLLLAALLCSTLSASAAVTKPAREEIRVNYLDLDELHEMLKRRYSEFDKVILEKNKQTSRITIDPTHPEAEAVRKMIADLDVRPTQIVLQAEIAEVKKDESGKREVVQVLSQPTITFLERYPVSIHFKTPEGKEYEVKIKAQLIKPPGK
jgi:hypothetical protein